jgi:hypothetical protein
MVDLASRIAEVRATGLADQMQSAEADAEDYPSRTSIRCDQMSSHHQSAAIHKRLQRSIIRLANGLRLLSWRVTLTWAPSRLQRGPTPGGVRSRLGWSAAGPTSSHSFFFVLEVAGAALLTKSKSPMTFRSSGSFCNPAASYFPTASRQQ